MNPALRFPSPHLVDLFFGISSFIIFWILYGQTLGFDYVWDDYSLFIHTPQLAYGDITWRTLSEPILPDTPYFRPTVLFSWIAEFQFFGQNPKTSHLVNITILYVNTLLVYVLLVRVFGQKQDVKLAAFFAGLLYLCHPMQVEMTAWVSGRFDLLATFFALLTFHAFLIERRQALKLFLTCFFLSLALGSKEVAVFVPIWCFIVWALKHHQEGDAYLDHAVQSLRLNWMPLLGMFAILVIYFYLRHLTRHGIYNQDVSLESVATAVASGLPALAMKEYLQRLLLPIVNLGAFLPIPYFESTLNKAVSWTVVFSFVAAILYSVLRRSHLALLLTAFFLSIALVIYLIPIGTGGNIVQDRFLSLGLVFYALFIAYSTPRVAKRWRKPIAAFGSLYLLLVSAVTAQVLPIWKNEETLWYAMNQYQLKFGMGILPNYFKKLVEASQPNDVAIEEAIAEERVRYNGGLRVIIQQYYGAYLANHHKEEGLLYLRALINTFPVPNPDQVTLNADDYPTGLNSAYEIYLSYAAAVLVINGDIKEAQHYLELAEPLKKYTFSYRADELALRTALSLLTDDLESAGSTWNQLRIETPQGKRGAALTKMTVQYVCARFRLSADACLGKFPLSEKVTARADDGGTHG